jgi:hypothetical protein
MHCAVRGVLYMYFVTLLQATPDWFQYLPHVQHVGRGKGLNIYVYMTATKGIPTALKSCLQHYIK